MSLQLDDRQRAMLREMGVTDWSPRAASAPSPGVAAAAPADSRASTAPANAATSASHMAPPDPDVVVHGPVAGLDWPGLQAAVSSCQACALRVGRKAPVLAVEPMARQTDWLVVGEPPDEEEERTGVPFAGPSGQLLDNMLRAVQVSRSASGAGGARVTNVVKCRSGAARNPQPAELAACSVYLRREIALAQPRVILAMGRFAALSLLGETHRDLLELPFGKLRGQVYRAHGVPVVVTYHPAKLLRAPHGKAQAWADLCLAQGVARPPADPPRPAQGTMTGSAAP